MQYLRTLTFVISYWRAYPRAFGILGTFVVAMTLCDVFVPVFAGRLADAVAPGLGTRPSDMQIRTALFALLGLLAMESLWGVLRVAQDKLWIWVAAKVIPRIVKDAFYRVQRFATDWHGNNFSGATVRKITRGMWAYDILADTILFGIVPTTLITIGMSVMVGLHWPAMGVFLGLFLIVYVSTTIALASRYVGPANEAFVDHDSLLGARIADSITCNAVVKSFGAEDREDALLRETADRWSYLARHAWNRGINTFGVQTAFNILMLTTLLGATLWFWARAEATPGQITLVLTTFLVIANYLRNLGMHIRNFQKGVNELEDVIAFEGLPFTVTNHWNARRFRPERGEIRIEGVTFHYGAQPTPLFRNLSLTVRAGERVALVGHSGSGKSTFVKLVQRLYDVNEGRVLIDGQDIAGLTQESLRENIALVAQEPILFHRSLRANIAYGRPEASEDEIVAAAKKAHAHEFIAALPEGYATLVGERGVKLSGGERQRVALARAFLADCPILILDEATSSLDSLTEAHIQQSIQALMANRTTIVIAHRLSTIRRVDRILVFDKGRIIEEGSHEALMADPQSHYRALVAIQLRDGALHDKAEKAPDFLALAQASIEDWESPEAEEALKHFAVKHP